MVANGVILFRGSVNDSGILVGKSREVYAIFSRVERFYGPNEISKNSNQ